MRTNFPLSSLGRQKSPISSEVVPLTKAESGKDNNTTLAYCNGWFCSSTNLPLIVCACTATAIIKKQQRIEMFLKVFIMLIFYCFLYRKDRSFQAGNNKMHLSSDYS